MSKRKKKYKPTAAKAKPATKSVEVLPKEKETLASNGKQKILAGVVFLVSFLFLLWSSPSSIEARLAGLNSSLFSVVAFFFAAGGAYVVFSGRTILYRVLSGFFLVVLFSSILLNIGIQWDANPALLKAFSASGSFLAVATLVLGFPFVLKKKREPEELENRKVIPENTVNKVIPYILLVAITLGSLSLYLYKNDHFDVFEDEFQMMSVGKGFKETNKQVLWDYKNDKPTSAVYGGVWPHTVLLGTAFKIFGESPEVGRTLSGILGAIFILSFYFFGNYFIRNKWITLFVLVLIILHPSILHLFRYIRMYVLLIPLTSLTIWAIYKGLEGENKIVALQKYKFFEWANFNYVYLLLVLPLLYLNYIVHQVALVVAPAAAIYLFVGALVFREAKYYVGVAMVAFVVLVVYFFVPSLVPVHVMSFFEGRDYSYVDWLGDIPMYFELNLAIVALGMASLVWQKEKAFLKQHLFIITLVVAAYVFFIFIADYQGHDFRFISHIAPWFILLVSFHLYRAFRLQFNKPIAVTLVMLFLLPKAITGFSNNVEKLYVYDPSRPQYAKVYQLLEDKINIEEEALFGQYFKSYYASSLLRKNVDVVSMQSNKTYSYEQFVKDLNQKEQGWICWATYKGWHIDEKVMGYIYNNFRQYAGSKKDSSGMELYYFNKSMLPGTEEYNALAIEKFPVNVWYNPQQDFTAHFSFNMLPKEGQAPVIFQKKDSAMQLSLRPIDTTSQLLVWQINELVKVEVPIPTSRVLNVILSWKTDKKTGTASVYFDGKKQAEETLIHIRNTEQQLYLPKMFPGNITLAEFYLDTITEDELLALSRGVTIEKISYRNYKRNE